jgi:hypothetical protein
MNALPPRLTLPPGESGGICWIGDADHHPLDRYRTAATATAAAAIHQENENECASDPPGGYISVCIMPPGMIER